MCNCAFNHRANLLKATQRVLTLTFLLIIGIVFSREVSAQNFPVRSTVQLLPPHPLNLSGYSDLSANGIQATLILNEAGRLQYPVKLRITIEGQDIFMQTKSTYQPPPIFLDGNIPVTLLGSDLAGYFNPRNFNISGGSAELVRRGGNLPEGLYTFTVEVLDFNRNIVVSNTGQARAWLILNDPPILNQPANTKKVSINGGVQNIFFQWTPRHTASPNAAFNVRYVFELFEILPKGRNPNDIALTTSPIYSNVLFANSLVYGPGEPQLFRGTDYAWRVKAIDESGKDLFKNNGFSEVFSFTYGDACKTPDGITATAVSHKLLRFQWNQGIEQDGYEVQVKKADRGEDAWRGFSTETAEREVSFVEAETTYSYRVFGVCGNVKSAPSEEQTITTPAVEEFACGDEEVPFVPLSNDPANYLGYGSVITAANFEVFVTSAIKNPDGTFTGTGLMELPFLKSIRVGAVFKNIGVNKEFQLISGMIETTHKPVETILNLDSLGGGNTSDGDVDIISSVEDATGADTVIVVGLDIDSIYVDGDNNVVVVDPEGNEQVVGQVGVDSDGDGQPDTETVAIVDEDGDTYVATTDGVTNAGNFGGSGSGSSKTPPVSTAPGGSENRFNIIATFSVDGQYGTDNTAFAAGAASAYKYGFDSPPDDETYKHYESSQINEDTYKAAWRSVETGRVAYIRSGYKPEGDERLNVVYRSEDYGTVSHTPATAGSNDEEGAFYDQLLVQGRSHESVERIYAMAQDGEGDSLYEEAIGRVNVVSYDEKRIDLAVVPINGAEANLSNLQAELNKIFGQAVVQFNTIDVKANVDVPNWDKDGDKLFDAETNAGFRTAEMNAVRKAVKAQHGIDKHTYYVFLIPHPPKQSGRVGIMRRKSQYAYIFSDRKSQEQLVKAIAHELGHGIFHLRHSWEDNDINKPGKDNTANLMDYDQGSEGLGTDLLYPQWQDIHNPDWVIGLFENGDGSAYEDEDAEAFEAFYTLFETELTNEDSDLRQTLEKLKAIEEFIEFYSQCSESKWISYENKGVVPYCLWVDSDSPSIPFLSGLVDGAYQEVEAVQQMDNLARALVAGTWELIDAYTVGYWECNPNRMDVRSEWLEQSLARLKELEDESGFIAWLSEKKAEYSRDRLVEYFEACREVYETRESVDELYAFITDWQELLNLYNQISADIEEYFTILESPTNLGYYKRGQLVIPIGTIFIEGAGLVTKIPKVKTILRGLKELAEDALKWRRFTDKLEDAAKNGLNSTAGKLLSDLPDNVRPFANFTDEAVESKFLAEYFDEGAETFRTIIDENPEKYVELWDIVQRTDLPESERIFLTKADYDKVDEFIKSDCDFCTSRQEIANIIDDEGLDVVLGRSTKEGAIEPLYTSSKPKVQRNIDEIVKFMREDMNIQNNGQMNGILRFIDLNKRPKNILVKKGDILYRYEKKVNPNQTKQFFIDYIDDSMGITQVGFENPENYLLFTYEVLEDTNVLETIIRGAKTEQLMSGKLQNVIKQVGDPVPAH